MPNEPKINLPASLLVENKPCLVVGGGKVADRKARNLLAASAKVTVVAPEISEEIAKLAEIGKIEYKQSRFDEKNIQGMFLVFAATDSEDVNKSVLKACRESKVLCCCVDSSWRDSDFVSPASFTLNGITVTVSTGGRSCTEARDIKNSLREFLENMDELTSIETGSE